MADSDNMFGDDPEMAKFAEEVERNQKELYERISEFMDEADIGEAYTSQLLIEAAIRMRMTAYGMDVEKPSISGLKLDLDRLSREVEDYVRDAKKGAEAFIEQVKAVRAAEEEDGAE
jgi:hypothetical protein